MTEPNQNLDEIVNEEKNSEIKPDFTKPTSDKVHDNDNKVINQESDEMTSNLDNQSNPPSNLNKLDDDESNNTRQFNPSSTLNESTNSSPEISTISNESNNDKQNSSSNTFNDLSDDKQNSSIIPKDDKQTSFHDDKPIILNYSEQTSSPNISNDSEQTSSPNILNDTEQISSHDDKPIISNSSPNILNDTEQISSHDDKPIVLNDSEQTKSHDDKPNISNDDEQTRSHDDKSNISNDDEQTRSHDDKSNISNDYEQTNSHDDKSNISNDNEQISSHDDKQISPPNISNDVKQVSSNNDEQINEQINSQIASTISIDDIKISSPISNTSNEYLNDDSKESNQPSDTNKDTSKHSPSEDDISSNAESEIQQEKEQNQLTGTSLHDDKDSFNTSDDEGFEIVQKDKPADSIGDLSKHVTNDGDYSFIRELGDNRTEFGRPIESPFKHEYNEDDKLSNDEIVESNSDDDEYDDDDSHKESEYTERKEDYKTKEESQLANTDNNEFKPDSSAQNHTFTNYNSYTGPRKNEEQVIEQQIRERRRLNQQHQEPSENITSPKRSNVRTDTHHQSISFPKILRNILFLILILAAAYFIYDIARLAKKPSSLRNIADITDNIFEDINNVELPAISIISDYEVECRRAAITVERYVPFKTHDSQIAKGLNEIKNAISNSRKLLLHMYSKGSTLRSSFESEIEAILQRLNSNHIRHDDARYIRDRLDKLTKKIKDIKLSTEKSHNSILEVKKIRTYIDNGIKNGLKDAEKYNKNEKYSFNIDKVKKEIENVDNTLSKLYINIDHLEKLREILSDYEGKLMGILDELDEFGDKGARILKADIKHLRVAVENTKVRNHIFNRLANAD